MEIINVHMLSGGDNESHISRCATVNIDVCDGIGGCGCFGYVRPDPCSCVTNVCPCLTVDTETR